MLSKKNSFGNAKPLPGQSGYKMKKSEKLESEATAMADKLENLRQTLITEKQKREKVQLVGGSRWGSARADKGSVRNYSQDVLKRKGNSKAKKARATSAVKLKSNSAALQWTVQDVKRWLDSIQLSEYADKFENNEIDGSTLLEMGLDDLDYLEMKKLAHRKLLLKSIEQLKRGEVATLPPPQPIEDVYQKQKQSEIIVSEGKQHWSNIAPISQNEVDGTGNDLHVNLADGEFNEDESHASFMKALLEWRNTDAKDTTNSSNDDGMWKNPFGGQVEQDDAPKVDPNGGKLLEGTFDEEAEHENFRKAVQAWRTGDSVGASNNATDAKRSCWQCYKLYFSSLAVVDAETKKECCSEACMETFRKSYNQRNITAMAIETS